MAFNNPPTKSENYVFGRGILFFAPFDANGVPMGERDLGNVPGFTLSVETERYQHRSSRSGRALIDRDIPISTDISASITVEDMSADNQALFIAGEVKTRTQASTPVTGEIIHNIEPNRQYQLGATALNPTGVRGVSSVTAVIREATTAPTIATSTAYLKGTLLKNSTNLFVVTTAGTTAGSAPSYAVAAVGDATTDGTAVVKFLGSTAALVGGTDYVVSPEAGRLTIPTTGALAAAYAALPLDDNGKKIGLFSLTSGYTPAANSRTQVVSTGEGSTNGQLRFVADNAEGENRDLFIASCSLGASGDNPFITEDEFSSFEVEVGVNSRDSNTPQIIIDGRPVT